MKFVILCAIMTLGVPAVADAACQRKPVSYDEPAQRLDQGVQRIARRSGCFVEIDLPRHGPRRTAAIRGMFTPQDALARMVRPARLTVATDAQGTGYRLTSSTPSAAHTATGAGTGAGDRQREARIHRHAAAIDRQIDAAVRGKRLSPGKAADLHRQVGQVQVAAGHAGRTQTALTAQQASAFDATLTELETMVGKR